MITVYSFIFCLLILHRRLIASPMTAVFLLAYLIKVIFPFYYFSQNSEISFISDILAASSLLIVVFLSLTRKKYSRRTGVEITVDKGHVHGAMFLLPFAWLLFFIPALYEGELPPIWLAVTGDYIGAHDVRVYITKSSTFGLIIDIVGKVVFPILLLFISVSYKSQNRSERVITYFLLISTVIVSFSYFQKAFPFTLILTFAIGLSLCGYMSIRKWVWFGVLCAVLLLLISRLYGSDFGVGALKFQDLLFRRLGKTPVIVYESYIEYGQLYGLAFLEYSFVLNKTPDSPALPMVIYQYMQYGTSSTGWANGLYVGDLFVNFGIYGVVAGSMLIGRIIKMGNNFLRHTRHNIFFLVGLLGMTMFCLALPGNSFFAFSTFFYFFLFLSCYVLNQYVVVRKSEIVIRLRALSEA